MTVRAWLTMLVAAMFGMSRWYLRRLMHEVQEALDGRELVRPQGAI